MGRGGAVSSRGRGKFKVSRGGGRHFSRDLDPRDVLKGRVRGSDDDEEEESSEEESEESEDEDSNQPQPEVKLSKEMAALNLKLGNTEAIEEDPEENMTRAERKAMKKAQAEAKAKKGGKAKKESSDEDSSEEDDIQPLKAVEKPKPKPAAQELSRKDREAAEKKAAQERYAKLHAQGKTSEAKTDLARLQEVRRRREQAAAQREAEAAEAAKEAEAKKTQRK